MQEAEIHIIDPDGLENQVEEGEMQPNDEDNRQEAEQEKTQEKGDKDDGAATKKNEEQKEVDDRGNDDVIGENKEESKNTELLGSEVCISNNFYHKMKKRK